MKIWVDADACPVVIKEMLYRAALSMDQRIAEEVQAGDLVITADVPLVAQVIGKGGSRHIPKRRAADRCEHQGALALRDFMEGLRSSGVETGGPAAFSSADWQTFADQVGRLLARRH